jgi:hypothetical protein
MYNGVFSRTFSGAEYYSGKINQSLVMCKFNTNKSRFSTENHYLRASGAFLAFPVVFGCCFLRSRMSYRMDSTLVSYESLSQKQSGW